MPKVEGEWLQTKMKMNPIHIREMWVRRQVCHESVSQSWTNTSYQCSQSSHVEGHIVVKVAMSAAEKFCK